MLTSGLYPRYLHYHNEYKKAPTLDVFKVQLSKVDNDILKKTVIDQLKTRLIHKLVM